MPDAPPLNRTELPLVKERIRDAWRSAFPEVEVPAALLASERPIQAVTLAERSYSGLLVALWLNPEQAAQLAIDGGEPADALHLTLAYCPEMADTDDVTLARIVAALADVAALETEITGRVGGFGRFFGADGSDGQDVFYAAPDIPILDFFRESVLRALGQAGVYQVSRDHSYTPHITLAYLPSRAKTPAAPPAIDLAFTGITVVAGERRVDIPFWQPSEGTEYVGIYDSPYAYYAERTATQPRTGRAKDAWRFSSPRRFADAEGWIQALPPPGTYHHSLWGLLQFTPERYERMLVNFRDGVYAQTLPINAEHDMDASGAIGWITDMRLGADGSIEVKADWNDRGRALIEGDRFRYVSAEWWEEWQDPVSGAWIPDVFSGLAICTHPHFKTDVLRPLAAGERDTMRQAGEARQEGTGVPNDAKQQPPANEAVQLSEAELAAFRQFQELGGASKLTELSEAVTTLSERNANLEAEARKKRFTDIVRGRAEGADGVAWRGDAERHVTHMTKLAEAFGDQSPELADYIADRTADAVAFAEAVKPLMSATGTSRDSDGGPSAEEQIEQLAKGLRESDPALTEEQAVAKAYANAPAELKQRYRAERPRNRAGSN